MRNSANNYVLCSYLPIFFFFLIFSGPLHAQHIIKGQVTDKNNVALVAANVTIKDSKRGTATDSSGRFIISASAGEKLEISFIGYRSRFITIVNETELNITLEEEAFNLNDVIVIGYGTVKKKDLTGSVGSVSSTNFNKGIFTSPDQLIQGKVSGLQITNNNGLPGAATTIRIRGNSALSGTGQPLFVVDGIPLDGRSVQAGNNPLNFLDPADIASIDVLKDASATAIYGSRAAYGVVIINTKKGSAGPTKLNVGISTGLSSILKKIKVLSAAQYREAIPYYNVNPAFDRGGNSDALDAILQNGFQTNYSVGISGGNENAVYRFSGNLTNQDGIMKNTGFKKYGVNLSGNFKFLDNKKLGVDINVISSQYIQVAPQPDIGSAEIFFAALRWNPTDSLRNMDGSFKKVNGALNPVAATELIKNNLKVTTVLGSVSPYYKFTDWLEYRLLYSVNYSTGIARSSLNQDIVSPGSPPGTATIKNNELTTTQITHTLNFNKEIFPSLKLNAVAGYEFTRFNNKGFSLTGNGVPGTGFGNFGLDYSNYIQYSAVNNRSISSFEDPSSELRSFFGRSIFDYKEKYLLTATLRADGSSKFGENNRYGYFPSFAVAWNISKEDFFHADFVNLLKIRVGWGKTGNQEFPAGSAQARYSFFDGGTIRQVNNPNPDLKWQSDRQYDIGVDFSLLKNRISGTIDYFNKTTTSLLFPSQPIQPAPADAAIRWINLDGEIRNKGFELQVNTAIISKKDFGFDLNANATFLKNKVSGLSSPIYTGFVSGPVQIIENGYPMNTFFTRKFLGNDKNGFSNYADSGATFYHVGNPNPKALLGIGTIIRYKKLSLSANMSAVFGQDIYFIPLMAALNVGGINVGNNIGLAIFKDPVKESVANPVTPSSRYIIKGNYLKLNNVTLNYALGNVKNVFKDANIYCTGQNLFIITKYPGFSPETNFDRSVNGVPSLGLDAPHYPSSRTIILGINFSL